MMISTSIASLSKPLPGTFPGPAVPGTADDTAFRQLRHQTKNALQRILCEIEHCRDLQATLQGQRLVSDLERRVRLSSAVSDALFGVVSAPGPLLERLRRMGEATVELMGDVDQLVTLDAVVTCDVPPRLHDILTRIAHEFVGNAVKHGLHARSVGRVAVRVDRGPQAAVRLQVFDDGWGPCPEQELGGGMRVATALAEQHRGKVTLGRRNGLTVAEALLHPR